EDEGIDPDRLLDLAHALGNVLRAADKIAAPALVEQVDGTPRIGSRPNVRVAFERAHVGQPAGAQRIDRGLLARIVASERVEILLLARAGMRLVAACLQPPLDEIDQLL